MALTAKCEPIALVDWDGTLRPEFTIFDWALFLQSRGALSQDVMMPLHGLLLDYEERRLTHDQLAQMTATVFSEGLRGVPRLRIYWLAREFVRDDQRRLLPFVVPLLRTLRAMGLRVVLVTGAPRDAILPYRRILEFDELIALTFSVRDDRYTGAISFNPGTAAEKRVARETIAGARQVAIAIGDSPSDVPLFEAARVRVAVGDGSGLESMKSLVKVTGELEDVDRVRSVLLGAI